MNDDQRLIKVETLIEDMMKRLLCLDCGQRLARVETFIEFMRNDIKRIDTEILNLSRQISELRR